MLKMAKRSQNTIGTYRKVLLSYAKFLDVPLDKVHDYLIPENLIKYAASRADKSEAGTRLHLSVLHRYFQVNGVRFDTLELNILKAQREDERGDKPLEPANPCGNNLCPQFWIEPHTDLFFTRPPFFNIV
jgi:hypothetical protein